MLYEDFRGTITQVLIAEKKLNIRDENIVVHYKGEVADDERGRLWIKDVNQKYYQKESDTLLGDFLVIELEHLGETSMVIRYDLQSLYGAYCSSGWDAVFENVEDKLNMCKSGQEKIKHIANYEKMCDWLVVRPVNYVERKSALQKAIYKRVGDMALVIYILLYADQNNYNTCLCQKEIVENWDVSEEELWEVAMRNTMMDALPRIYYRSYDTVNPPYTKGAFMAAGTEENFRIGKDDNPMVTTVRGINGAIAMFYPGVQEELAELTGGDYYVAFSSVDGAMIHSVDGIQPRDLLWRLKCTRSMMTEGLLSKYVYKYNSEKKQLEQMYL